MLTYILKYRYPYEYDDDSSSGIGDHMICYSEYEVRFRSLNDEDAWRQVERFLEEGSIVFDHCLDGDGKTYKREFISLYRAVG